MPLFCVFVFLSSTNCQKLQGKFMIFDAPAGPLHRVAQAFFFYKELQPRRRMAAERNAAAGVDQKSMRAPDGDWQDWRRLPAQPNLRLCVNRQRSFIK